MNFQVIILHNHKPGDFLDLKKKMGKVLMNSNDTEKSFVSSTHFIGILNVEF